MFVKLHVILQIPLGIGIVLSRLELDIKPFLDGEHTVVVNVFRLLVEDLSGEGLEAFR